MSKLKQTKIPMTLEDNVLKVALEQGIIENEFNWKLVREHDGKTNHIIIDHVTLVECLFNRFIFVVTSFNPTNNFITFEPQT